MNHLFVFHYHLLPGGVTSVIRDGIKAAGTYLKDLSEVTLVAGKQENTNAVITEIRKYFEQIKRNIHVDFILLKEMDYLYPDKAGTIEERFVIPDFEEKAKKLSDKLILQFSTQQQEKPLSKLSSYKLTSSIWWVHNYHLGKNPIFTEALLIIADKYSEQRIILQIHDFPESGRFENLKFLKANITFPLYPVSNSIRYAVINTRDLRILTVSGIPAQHVFLLENPVEILKRNTTFKEKELIRNKIFNYYKHNNGILPYKLSQKIGLYPVRTIRRKNVLESASLISLLNRETLLFVTLPGVSMHEKPYSDAVKSLYSQGYIRGSWGIGTELGRIGITFTDIMDAGDIVLSSSVQEGFGFLFIQAVMWGLPLYAKNIEVLAGIKELFQNHPHFFYDKFLCLLEKKGRKLLLDEYEKKLQRINWLLPDISIEIAETDLKMELETEIVDFSFLNVPFQIKTLKKIKIKKYFDEVKSINREMLNRLDNLTFTNDKIDPDSYEANLQSIEKRFGYRAYAETLRKIVLSFSDTKINKKDHKILKLEQIEADVIDNFFKKDYLRLIYE